MKRFLLVLCTLFICTVCNAQTIRWHTGNDVYETTTCTSGDTITPPTAPTKMGYTFQGWAKFRRIEYLQCTALGQYINTGVQSNKDTYKFVIEFEMTSVPTTWYALFGSYVDENNNSWRIITSENATNTYANSNKKAGGATVSLGSLFTNRRYNIELDYNSVTVNGQYYAYNTTTKGTTNNSEILLFSQSTVSSKASPAIGAKIYHFKVYDNNVLIRDMVPCLDASNRVGMYDLVQNRYYYNAGTGSFTAGSIIGE